MATITPEATPIAGGWLVGWHNVSAGDTCTAWPIPGGAPHPNDVAVLTDRSGQLFGGTTGTVFLEGSNQIWGTTTFATLHLVDGTTAYSMTAAGIRQVLEATYYTRPAFTAASANTNFVMKFTINSERR